IAPDLSESLAAVFFVRVFVAEVIGIDLCARGEVENRRVILRLAAKGTKELLALVHELGHRLILFAQQKAAEARLVQIRIARRVVGLEPRVSHRAPRNQRGALAAAATAADQNLIVRTEQGPCLGPNVRRPVGAAIFRIEEFNLKSRIEARLLILEPVRYVRNGIT